MRFGRRKKGQAAMEFLMTYGWAILIAIIAIAALIAFGVLNVGRTSANICTLTAPLECKGSVSFDDETVDLEIYNGGTTHLCVTEATISGTGSSDGIDCTITFTGADQDLSAESMATFADLACTGGELTDGNKYKGTISVRYQEDSDGDCTSAPTGLERVSTGSYAQTIIAA